MRYLTLCVSVLALCAPGPAVAGTVVSAFYYPWFGTTTADGDFAHWAQGGHAPPMDIASNYYPSLGVYSSSSVTTLSRQMADMAGAGIDELAVSWWGRGSAEDQRLPSVLAAAQRQGIAVAAHLEPYAGRTIASTLADVAYLEGLGVRTFYLYRPFDLPPDDWAAAERPAAPPRPRGLGADVARRRRCKGTFQRRLHLRHARLRRRSVRTALPSGARQRPALRAVGRARIRRRAGDRRRRA